MGQPSPGFRSSTAYGAWAVTALLATLLLLGWPNEPLLARLGLHKGMQRGTVGYVRLLKDAGPLLPPVLHDTVEPDDMLPGRVIVIGDVHGCLRELDNLLDKVDYQQGHDTLVLAGDLVDKGPDSVGVLHRVQHKGALAVRGNHDDAGLTAWESWQQGGKLKEKHKWVKDLKHRDAQWLYLRPWSLSLPTHNVAIVHAGVVPDIALERQSLWDMYQMRGLIARSHGRWIATNSKSSKITPWATRYNGPDHVLFGHDSRKGLQDETYATGLDTGCAAGGRLTACILPPASEVRRRRSDWPSATTPVTLDMLGGTIVSTPSLQNYMAPGACNGSSAWRGALSLA